MALRCHFEPLTGEVCIAGADGPDSGSLAGLKDGKGVPVPLASQIQRNPAPASRPSRAHRVMSTAFETLLTVWDTNLAGKKRSKLRRRLMSVISPARAAAMKAAEKAVGAAATDPLERYPVPYTLAVSTVDKLTLELDFCAEDIAGGEGPPCGTLITPPEALMSMKSRA